MSTSESPVACTIPGPDGVQLPQEVCEPCCNCQNYEAEIKADAIKSYFESTQVDKTKRQMVSFKIIVKLNPLENDKNGKEVRVIVRIYPDVIAKEFSPHYEKFISDFFTSEKNIIDEVWSNKYKILLRQMKPESPSEDLCPPEELPIRFSTEIVRDVNKAHYLLRILHREEPEFDTRSNVKADIITLYSPESIFTLNHGKSRPFSDPPIYEYKQHDGSYVNEKYVVPHEFGHMIGLTDEYLYSGHATATVQHFPPPGDVQQQTSISMSTQRIMNSSIQHIYEYHLYPIAIEVQKLLVQVRGNEHITCKVIKI